MNIILQKFARHWLKTNTSMLTPEEQMVFNRLYSHKNLANPLDQVIDKMDDSQLDWAMMQVERTIQKNIKKL